MLGNWRQTDRLALSEEPGYNPPMTDKPETWAILSQLLAANWDHHGASLRDSIPWPEVAHLARSDNLGPLLYAAAQRLDLDIPDGIRATLELTYYQAAIANTLHLERLSDTLSTLARDDEPVLLLKGIALAENLYGNVALRPTGDSDLVVSKQQVPAYRRALLELGYVPLELEFATGAQLAYRNEEALTLPETPQVVIELHWHLLDLPYYLRKVPMNWFWENTQSLRIGGQSVKILNPEANLLYLPAHLALHHRFHGLRWFVDLALLVHKHQDTLDWDNVIDRAEEFELVLVLRETLDRLAGYWPSLPLKAPRRRLHDLEPSAIEARLFRLLTAEPRSPLLDFYTDIICLPDLRAKGRFVLLNVFPQPAYMDRRYGTERMWQLPFWYLYRFGDGVVKMIRTLPQAIRLR
jgi:hypothetical protein